MKKFLSILMVAAMILSLGAAAFAQNAPHTPKHPTDNTGTITLTNATVGQEYELYKLFDAERGNDSNSDGIVYKLPDGKTLTAPATDWFVVKADGNIIPKGDTTKAATCGKEAHTHVAACYDNGDPATGTLTCGKDEHTHDENACYPPVLTANVIQSDAFQNWAKGFGTKVTFAGGATSVMATETTINFQDLELGYYMIVSSLDYDTNKHPANMVTITSTNPSATVIDKNQGPEWDNGDGNPGKVIIDDQLHCGKEAHTHDASCDPDNDGTYDCGKEAHAHTPAGGKCYETQINEANLNEQIHFNIGVTATNFNKDAKIWKYVITDAIAPGMSYLPTPALKVIVAGNELASTDYTIKYYSTNEYWDSTKEVLTTDPDFQAKAQFFRVEIPWTDLSQLCANADHVADPSQHTEACKTKPIDCDFLYPATTEIHVDYYGIIDPNKAEAVNFDNNPNLNKSNFTWYEDEDEPQDGKDPDHDKPEKETKTFITELKLRKVDGNGNALAGAEFTLTGASTLVAYTEGTRFVKWAKDNAKTAEINDGNDYDAQGRPQSAYIYWLLKDGTYTTVDPATSGIDATLYATPTTDKYIKETYTEVKGNGQTNTNITATVNDSGELIFHGLAEGTYTLEETVVPAGYNKAENITFTVTFAYDEVSQTIVPVWSTDNEQVTYDGTNYQLTVTVVNKSGSELPETGGIGTTIFYVVGAILFLGAGVVLVTRRKVTE
ncbi:MAG: LPXTG cell wall anchor domain-containing protein [Oscillospiraceae bacterium]|nr:LPXTG cell wall anchor domain-containing protein [Oscillospiraceae bacterium]